MNYWFFPYCLTVFFYNFGMSDFGVSSLEGMLDAVKVLVFAVQEGKVAVHCHAGLGRTGKLQLMHYYFKMIFYLSIDFNISPALQVFLSHAIWSTPVESALVKLSTMFESEGLAPSRLDHRSIWCLISLGWWALSWPNTRVWTCGTVPPSVSGSTSCVRPFCCTGTRAEPSNTRPRSCTSSAACWSLSPRGLPVLQRSRENWRRGWTSWLWRRPWRWHFWRETCLLRRKGEAHAERTPASPGTSHLGSWRGRETSF